MTFIVGIGGNAHIVAGFRVVKSNVATLAADSCRHNPLAATGVDYTAVKRNVTVFSGVAVADARAVFTALRLDGTAVDGDLAAAAFSAAADTGCVITAGCGYVTAAYGNRTAAAVFTAADTRAVVAAGCSYGSPVDYNRIEVRTVGAADTRCAFAACRGYGSAVNSNRSVVSACRGADTRTVPGSGRNNNAAVYGQIACVIGVISITINPMSSAFGACADTRAFITALRVAFCNQRAGAVLLRPDGEGIPLSDKDTLIRVQRCAVAEKQVDVIALNGNPVAEDDVAVQNVPAVAPVPDAGLQHSVVCERRLRLALRVHVFDRVRREYRPTENGKRHQQREKNRQRSFRVCRFHQNTPVYL